MKTLIIVLSILFANSVYAESWIELERGDSCKSFIDRDSIKRKGDYSYYTTKEVCSEKNIYLDKFKHDCKYKARQGLWRHSYVIGYPDFDKILTKPTNMLRYDRNDRMKTIEEMVCHS